MKTAPLRILIWVTMVFFIISNSYANTISVDGCADQYTMALMEPSSDVFVSKDADANWSYYRQRAAQYQTIAGRAETLIHQSSNRVISQYGLDIFGRHFLTQLGIDVIDLPWNSSIALAATAYSEYCQIFAPGRKDCHKARTPSYAHLDKSALYITAGGVTAGRGTFIDNLITRAGLNNYERRRGWHAIPLEQLTISSPPDLIILAYFDDEDTHKPLHSATDHPVLRTVLGQIPRLYLSGASVSCNGWYVQSAITQIHDFAQGLFK